MKSFRYLFRKKIAIRWLLLIVMISFMKLDCFSQNSERLPDSINAGETIETYKADKESNQTHDSASNQTTQEDREDSVVFRKVPDSAVKLLKTDRSFAYANNPAYWKNTRLNKENNLMLRILLWVRNNPWAKRSLYVLFGAILLVVIYIIVIKNKLFIFYNSSNRPASEEDLTGDNDDPDFSFKIQEAINANDYRNAIRYLYLKTLKMAGERKLIKYNTQSTNQDYLTQLETYHIKESFMEVTDAYEKTNYGGFMIGQDQFLRIKERFEQLFKKITA